MCSHVFVLMEHTEEKRNMVNTLSICACWLATLPPVLLMATPMISLCVSKNSSYAYEMCKWIFFRKKKT